jgi:hypothetical protein
MLLVTPAPGDEGLFSKAWQTKAWLFKKSRQAFVVSF